MVVEVVERTNMSQRVVCFDRSSLRWQILVWFLNWRKSCTWLVMSHWCGHGGVGAQFYFIAWHRRNGECLTQTKLGSKVHLWSIIHRSWWSNSQAPIKLRLPKFISTVQGALYLTPLGDPSSPVQSHKDDNGTFLCGNKRIYCLHFIITAAT